MATWSMKANKGTGEGFAKAPPGNHPAVLVAVVDMGTQIEEFNGDRKQQRRAYFVWELVTEKVSGLKDRNHVIAIDMTVSLNEKAKLRQWAEARMGRKLADGENYDILQELGKPCLLSVVEKNGYPKIQGVSAVPKGLTVPPPQNTPFSWALDDAADDGTFELPDWLPYHYGKPIAEKIQECVEWNPAAKGPKTGVLVGPVEDVQSDGDIPF